MRLFQGNSFFILILFLALPGLALGQNQNEITYKLALDFFQNKEYEKSIDLLQDLYKSDKSQQIYLPLFASYLQTKQYKEAEEIVKKQLRKSYGDPLYTVDYGHVLTLMGERKEAEDLYEKAIKDLLPRSKDILDLANSFQRRNEMIYAIRTLKKGKKLTPSYGYQFELAELYYQNRQIEEMIDEYLDLISLNDAYLQNVQNALNTSIYQDLDAANLQVLNTALLRRIQRQPDQEVFLEMLIWHYLQQKDFEGAILQTKALDRRYDEGGKRLISLGQSCVSNKEYDLAMECYQYVIDQGTSTRHYVNARVLLTMAIREKITSAPYSQQDLVNLESNYIKTLDDVGRSGATVKLQIGLAEVWAFYLNKTDKAVALLQRALNEYQLLENDAAKCKLVLADIYLRQGEIWEASLLYSQVEKDFKYEALGDEAKFKNAKVYFYTGDYNWAKAQLDVLKGSTSKLIANDAMRLSLIISDNLLFDTTGQALKDYAASALLFDQGDYPSALKKLEAMERIYVVHEIIDEVYYMQFEVFMKKQDYESAAAKLQLIIKDFPDGILGDEAVFNLAVIYQQYLNEEDLALEMYKKLLTDYPASIYVAASRRSYRNARQKIEN